MIHEGSRRGPLALLCDDPECMNVITVKSETFEGVREELRAAGWTMVEAPSSGRAMWSIYCPASGDAAQRQRASVKP